MFFVLFGLPVYNRREGFKAHWIFLLPKPPSLSIAEVGGLVWVVFFAVHHFKISVKPIIGRTSVLNDIDYIYNNREN